ncbi:ABC transporter substrate-binding protein [Nesterenkonia suensis]
MSTFRSRRCGVVAASAAGALVLAGCSGPEEGSATGATGEFSYSYAVTNADVVPPYRALADAYMEENPGVDITLHEVSNESYGQTITTQLNAGNAPDVFQTAPGHGRVYSVVPLVEAELIAPLGDDAATTVPSGSESQFQIDGDTFGVAFGLTFVGAVLNSTTAESAGFDYPADWDGLLSACEDVADDGRSVFVLAGAAPPNTGLLALGIAATRVYAENPQWDEDRAEGTTTFSDSQGWKDTLHAIEDLNEARCLQGGVEGAGFDVLASNLQQDASFAAIAPSGAAADFGQNAPDHEFTVQPLPPAPGGDPFGIVGADYALSLNADAETNEAAIDFLEWTTGDEGQRIFAEAEGSLPFGDDLSDTIYASVEEIVNQEDFVPRPSSNWSNPAVFEALGVGVQGLLTGQKDVDEVLRDMDAAWE